MDEILLGMDWGVKKETKKLYRTTEESRTSILFI
jgi:hypothetical protein